MLSRLILLVFLAGSVLFVPARAEELTQEKRADIEHLLVMTGSLSLGKQMAAAVVVSLTEVLRQARPDIPSNVLNLLPAEVTATFEENIDSLKEAMIPLYHKHFTASEIKEMIQFYSTELGKKSIKLMPTLMQEGMVIGQKWGKSLEPKVQERVTTKLRQQGVKI